MILVDAVYTNQSGSKRLLEYFIRYSYDKGLLDNYFFLFDGRIESDVLSLVSKEKYIFSGTTETDRRKYYQKLPDTISSVFCFGSVPPPIKIKDRPVTILQHNPFFFETPGFSLRSKILYLLKRLYIRNRCHTSYDWIVQTQRIKDLLIKFLRIDSNKIAIKPFFEIDFFNDYSPLLISFPLKFIYPADGVPQKNHNYLFSVWEDLLKKYHLAPELHVTLPDHYTHHIETIIRLQQAGVQIFNHGFVSKSEIKTLYQKSHFMIFPSMSESFGLPLAEAASTGLNVIGSDLPYLYQVIEPSATFNPKKKQSLLNLIVSLHEEPKLKNTKVLLKNNISEVVKTIHSNSKISIAD